MGLGLAGGALTLLAKRRHTGGLSLAAGLGVLALATFLRVYRLDGQSFWSDEGATAYMTQRGFGEILAVSAADIHPPLYYLLATAWAKAAGTSEFALRYPAVLAGVLVVALTLWIGRRCLGPVPGIAGSFVAAISVLLIYYSQEARMYQPLALFGTATAALAIALAGIGRCGRVPAAAPLARLAGQSPGLRMVDWLLAAGYIVVLAALLYTQYLGVLAALVASAIVLVRFARVDRWWRIWAVWLGLQAIAGLLFLPWALRVLGQVGGWPAISEPLAPGTYLQDVLRVFAYGLSWDATVTRPAELLIIGLLVLGLLWPLLAPADRRARWGGLALVLAIVVIPVAGLFLLSLRRPLYNPKFLMTAAPGFALWLGVGVAAAAELMRRIPLVLPGRVADPLARRLLATTLAVVTVAGLLGLYGYFDARSLRVYYVDPKYQRDDYRGLATQIEAAERPGDAVILNAPGQAEIFGYYYDGSASIYPLPADRPPDRAATEAALARIAAGHERVWLVLWATQQSDPDGIIETWLDQNAFKARSDWFGTVRLALYTVPQAGEPGRAVALDARFEQGIRLTEYQWAGGAQRPSAASGGILNLQLRWTADQPVDNRYVVFAHLIDEQENIWGQRDSEPAGGARPTSGWQAGEIIEDNRGIPVLAGTPPGDYQVEVGLYDPATGERLRTTEGETRLVFGPVEVLPAQRPDQTPDPRRPDLNLEAGPLSLLRVDLHALGRPESEQVIDRGASVRLATLWRVPAGPPSNQPRLRVALVDSSGATRQEFERPLTDGRYAPNRWRPGELILDQARWPVDLPPGRYDLRLTLLVDGREIAVGDGPLGAIDVRG